MRSRRVIHVSVIHLAIVSRKYRSQQSPPPRPPGARINGGKICAFKSPGKTRRAMRERCFEINREITDCIE